jgi:hypothetical protein
MLTPDPWEGMTDEHWAALAAISPLPDPVGGHGDVLADLGATPGPIGAAFRARRLLGLDRYGVPLRRGNGRPPGVDSAQERLDTGGYDACDGREPDIAGIGDALARIDRAALASAFWDLDTVQAAGLRRMVDAAVAGVDLPPGGRAAGEPFKVAPPWEVEAERAARGDLMEVSKSLDGDWCWGGGGKGGVCPTKICAMIEADRALALAGWHLPDGHVF